MNPYGRYSFHLMIFLENHGTSRESTQFWSPEPSKATQHPRGAQRSPPVWQAELDAIRSLKGTDLLIS